MAREEFDKRGLSSETKSIVVKVNGVDGRDLENGVQERVQSSGDFSQETTGEDVVEVGGFEALLSLQDLGKALGGLNAQGVSTETDFSVVGVVNQGLNVRIHVLGAVELEDLALEGEDFGRGHGGVVVGVGC